MMHIFHPATHYSKCPMVQLVWFATFVHLQFSFQLRSRTSEDEQKERLQWFHTTFLKPGYCVDQEILLAGLRSYDAHLSVTFISDMQHIVVKFLSRRQYLATELYFIRYAIQHGGLQQRALHNHTEDR